MIPAVNSPKSRNTDPQQMRRVSNTRQDVTAHALQKRQRGFRRKVLVLAVNTTLTLDQAETLLCCTGTHTQTLPAANDPGIRFLFKNTGVGVITIAGTIDGAAGGYSLGSQYNFVEVISDGTQWLVTVSGSN